MDASSRETAESAPRASVFLCGFRVAALFAVMASSALYSQYLNPAESTFCGPDSGCEAVRHASLQYFESPILSVPLLGLLAFATVYALSLAAPKSRVWSRLAILGGAAGLVLFVLQAAVIRAFCWLCVVVDVCAVLVAVFAWLHERRDHGRDPLALLGWSGLFVVAATAPFAWASLKPELAVPAVITETYEPGKLNVLEFADFECPYCRRLHPSLKRVLEDQPKERLHFVRGHVPLPSHPDAKPAARAAICAGEQGKEDALADKLVEMELTPSAIRRAAIEVGADAARFDECLASKRPDARIDADTRRLKSAGMRGLPTTYVGQKRLLGAVSEAAIRDAVDKAARGADAPGGIPGWLFLVGLTALAAAVAWLGRERRVTLAHEPHV